MGMHRRKILPLGFLLLWALIAISCSTAYDEPTDLDLVADDDLDFSDDFLYPEEEEEESALYEDDAEIPIDEIDNFDEETELDTPYYSAPRLIDEYPELRQHLINNGIDPESREAQLFVGKIAGLAMRGAAKAAGRGGLGRAVSKFAGGRGGGFAGKLAGKFLGGKGGFAGKIAGKFLGGKGGVGGLLQRGKSFLKGRGGALGRVGGMLSKGKGMLSKLRGGRGAQAEAAAEQQQEAAQEAEQAQAAEGAAAAGQGEEGAGAEGEAAAGQDGAAIAGGEPGAGAVSESEAGGAEEGAASPRAAVSRRGRGRGREIEEGGDEEERGGRLRGSRKGRRGRKGRRKGKKGRRKRRKGRKKDKRRRRRRGKKYRKRGRRSRRRSSSWLKALLSSNRPHVIHIGHSGRRSSAPIIIQQPAPIIKIVHRHRRRRPRHHIHHHIYSPYSPYGYYGYPYPHPAVLSSNLRRVLSKVIDGALSDGSSATHSYVSKSRFQSLLNKYQQLKANSAGAGAETPSAAAGAAEEAAPTAAAVAPAATGEEGY